MTLDLGTCTAARWILTFLFGVSLLCFARLAMHQPDDIFLSHDTLPAANFSKTPPSFVSGLSLNPRHSVSHHTLESVKLRFFPDGRRKLEVPLRATIADADGTVLPDWRSMRDASSTEHEIRTWIKFVHYYVIPLQKVGRSPIPLVFLARPS